MELLLKIFVSFLEIDNIYQCMMVSTRWKNFSQSTELWYALLDRDCLLVPGHTGSTEHPMKIYQTLTKKIASTKIVCFYFGEYFDREQLYEADSLYWNENLGEYKNSETHYVGLAYRGEMQNLREAITNLSFPKYAAVQPKNFVQPTRSRDLSKSDVVNSCWYYHDWAYYGNFSKDYYAGIGLDEGTKKSEIPGLLMVV